MKIITKKRIMIFFVVVLLSLFVIMKYVILWPGVFHGNNSLDKETNREIKSLLLNLIKKEHSSLLSINESEIYTDEFYFEYVQHNKSSSVKSIFITVDSKFMDTVEKTGDNEYNAELQLIWPDDWHYYVNISVINNQYLISGFGIDP